LNFGAFGGCEIDPAVLSYWRKWSDGAEVSVIEADYFNQWGASWNNIVCNPPYMRFQHFENRDSVAARFHDRLGIRLSGYTNIASAFLLKALSELNHSGRLAFVMPLEFLNTGYGTVVKRRLLQSGRLEAMIRLDCERDVFPDAITSVGILLFSKIPDPGSVKFCSIKSLDQLGSCLRDSVVREVDQNLLDPVAKWLPYFREDVAAVVQENFVPMSFYGRFSRGIATGANQFFVLRPSDIRRLGLADGEAVTCISRSNQLKEPVLDDAILSNLAASDAPIYLFSAPGNHSPAAASYIRKGEMLGVSDRYLTRSRNPWYKTESRTPASILLGVFSRGGYKVILNRTDALNLTCYHGFFPNPVGQRHVVRIFLYLLSVAGRRIISSSVRHYGDNLDKFEPGDLNRSMVPSEQVFYQLSDNDVSHAVNHLVEFGRIPERLEIFFSQLIISDGERNSKKALPAIKSCIPSGLPVSPGAAPELPLFCQR